MDKAWFSFLIPGMGWLDAWCEREDLNEEASWISVENLTHVAMVMSPAGKPQGASVDKMYERTSFNMGLALLFEETKPEKIKLLAEAWGRVQRATLGDLPRNGPKRFPND